MEIDYYSVICKGTPLAEHMQLGYAILFAKAVLNEFWQTNNMEVTIRREVSAEENGMEDK